MSQQGQRQLRGTEAEIYERWLVPAVFALGPPSSLSKQRSRQVNACWMWPVALGSSHASR